MPVINTTSNTSSLVVFCKRPTLGQGKQRLAASIGKQQALHVAECLLECALEDVRAWQAKLNGEVVLSPASEQDVAWAESLQQQVIADNVSILPQQQGNLGDRLQYVDEELRRAGHQKLIFIGTDAPALNIDALLAANERLANNDVVLQPASDGGVTMMSASCAWPELSGLPWSESNLQQALCAACLAAGRSVWLLPGSEDVDQWHDLNRVQSRLSGDCRPARQALMQCIAAIETV